jgi:hypothetical protein
MQYIFKKIFIVIGTIAVLAYGCGDDDDSTPPTTETPAVSLSGKLSQTYVNGATIFADKIIDGTTLGNYTQDTNEVSTTSDDTGQFDLDIPAGYNDYVLVSKGGMVEDASGNSVPAHPMLAPAGARNITPVTTIAALEPDLVTQIGEDYDSDIADASGVGGEILQLAKIAEAILDLLSDDDNQVVTDITDKFAVLQHVADAFDNIDLSDDSAVNTAASTAVDNILDDEAIVPTNTFADTGAKQSIADSFSQTIETITAAIDESADSAKESDILDEVEAAVDSGVGDISTEFKTVSTKITAIQFLDSNSSVLDQIQTIGFTGTKTLTSTMAEQTSKIAVSLSGNNDYATVTSYLSASISLAINDANTLRKATVEFTKADIIVAADGTITITISEAAKLKIDGTNAAGEQVSAELENTDATGAINDIVSNNQTVIFDLDALSAKIEAELGSDSDLFEISRIGDYIISINAEGVPFAPFAGNIIAQ